MRLPAGVEGGRRLFPGQLADRRCQLFGSKVSARECGARGHEEDRRGHNQGKRNLTSEGLAGVSESQRSGTVDELGRMGNDTR